MKAIVKYRFKSEYINFSDQIDYELMNDNLDFWLNDDVGKILTLDADGREVICLESNGKKYILKRIKNERLWRHLRVLLFGHKLAGVAVREANLRRSLITHGFATESPLAWGEQKSRFMYRNSFVLVPMVNGELLETLWHKLSDNKKIEYAQKYGKIVGSLHQKGFFQMLRCRDIIVDSDENFIIIDRECSRPGREPFFWSRSARNILRTHKRSFRYGFDPQMSQKQLTSFLCGLRLGLGKKAKFYKRIKTYLLSEGQK